MSNMYLIQKMDNQDMESLQFKNLFITFDRKMHEQFQIKQRNIFSHFHIMTIINHNYLKYLRG